MSVTGAEIVAKAEANVGQHEVPMGSNSGTFVEACQHDTFLGGTGWPWCAAHVCKVAKDTGVPLAPGTNSAGAHDLADRHDANRQTVASAEPGDVCDWNEGTGHTSILRRKISASTWETVDGNWGDAVAIAQHPVSTLRKVWRIPGVSGAAPVAPKPVPVWLVTTSVNGHRKLLFQTRVGTDASGKRRVFSWILHHSLARVAPHGITLRRGSRVL